MDDDVQNGRTYYYALVAYDTGDPENLFPSENSKFIQVLPSGKVITDQNTAVVIPSSFAAGYDLNTHINIQAGDSTVATGFFTVHIIDETQLTGHEYLVEFLDTSTDTIDNDNDSNLDMYDLDEYPPVTTYYSVLDITGIEENIEPADTLPVYFSHKHILAESFYIENSIGIEIPPTDYEIDFEKGKIWSSSSGSLGADILKVSYQYYPIYKSPYIKDSPWVSETDDDEIFDGVTLKFNNDWSIEIPDTNITWITTNASGLIEENGNTDLYRIAYVDSPTHCGFNVAELATAIEMMTRRLDTGTWGPVNPESLNNLGESMGTGMTILIFLFMHPPHTFVVGWRVTPYKICKKIWLTQMNDNVNILMT